MPELYPAIWNLSRRTGFITRYVRLHVKVPSHASI
jgi:hypothetical protein